MLMSVEQAASLIQSGKALSIAGDKQLLAALPKGQWIGGTIPYFVDESGGVHTRDRLFVTVQDKADALSAVAPDVVADTGHHDGRTVIAAHGVERDCDWRRQGYLRQSRRLSQRLEEGACGTRRPSRRRTGLHRREEYRASPSPTPFADGAAARQN